MRPKTKDPKLSNFYNDMNEHEMADYKRIQPNYVVELDSMPSGWQVTLWVAVTTGDGYAPPENDDNHYAWDAIGRQEFDDYDAGKSVYNELTGKNDVQTFREEHPYEGPRSPYSERVDE